MSAATYPFEKSVDGSIVTVMRFVLEMGGWRNRVTLQVNSTLRTGTKVADIVAGSIEMSQVPQMKALPLLVE
jgi:hypothetical protein